MALEKITQEQMDAAGVVAAPDILNGTAAENKRVFDRMVRDLVAPAFNACVDVVNEVQEVETGVKASEEERKLAENERAEAEGERAAAEENRSAAENERAEAEAKREAMETGYVAQAKAAADNAKSWAVGNTGTREGEDTDNAKYWAEQAKGAASGGDMNKAVYDPDNKATNIFRYVDEVAGEKAAKANYVTATMFAFSWSDNTYSFEDEYPSDQYNISIEVAPTATAEQFEAFGGAMICGSADSNVATAIGDVPTIDIPIIIKVVRK